MSADARKSGTRRVGRFSGDERPASSTLRGTAVATGLVAAVAAVVWAHHAFLILFGGVLFALMLDALTRLTFRLTRLGYGWSLGVVLLALLALVLAAGWFLAPQVGAQLDQLAQRIPELLQTLEQRLRQSRWGGMLLGGSLGLDGSSGGGAILSAATGALWSSVGFVTAIGVILFSGIYLAADSGLYVRGISSLVPPEHRQRADEVVGNVGQALKLWLFARFASMALITVATATGLMLLGLDLALALGLFAGILSFIPYLGPIIGFAPAILVASSQGGVMLAWVVGLYVGTQLVESYLVTPLIELRTVWLPPALTIGVQVVLGAMAGTLGFIFAGPLTVVAMVLVKMLYVEDTLGEKARVPGAD